jgi:hypothetical protein
VQNRGNLEKQQQQQVSNRNCVTFHFSLFPFLFFLYISVIAHPDQVESELSRREVPVGMTESQ